MAPADPGMVIRLCVDEHRRNRGRCQANVHPVLKGGCVSRLGML